MGGGRRPASAVALSFGAALPALVAVVAPHEVTIAAVSIAAPIFLVALGRPGLGSAARRSSSLRYGSGSGARWRWR
jgi:hypothetical protein